MSLPGRVNLRPLSIQPHVTCIDFSDNKSRSKTADHQQSENGPRNGVTGRLNMLSSLPNTNFREVIITNYNSEFAKNRVQTGTAATP